MCVARRNGRYDCSAFRDRQTFTKRQCFVSSQVLFLIRALGWRRSQVGKTHHFTGIALGSTSLCSKKVPYSYTELVAQRAS